MFSELYSYNIFVLLELQSGEIILNLKTHKHPYLLLVIIVFLTQIKHITNKTKIKIEKEKEENKEGCR